MFEAEEECLGAEYFITAASTVDIIDDNFSIQFDISLIEGFQSLDICLT